MQLLTPGLLFGLALWLSTDWYIGSLATFRKISVVIGCLLAFAVCGVVYEITIPSDWWTRQPWTWTLMKPYVVAPAAAFAVLTGVVRLVGGRVRWGVLFYVWIAGSVMGFFALFIIDEVGWRNRLMNIEILASACCMALQMGMAALIGWQLAVAATENDIREFRDT
ncbi:MAG: hypothetical protein R3C49_21035 [Planctomycetaceae bacterium]